MKFPTIPSLLVACLSLAGCLSKEPVLPTHFYHPALEPLAGQEVPGTRPLRFDPVVSDIDVDTRMLWRVSETEWVPDEHSLWARRPTVLLEERLRDRLFGFGGFRQTLLGNAPTVRVRIVAFHGTVGAEPVAHMELILDLDSPAGAQHRTRVVVEEPLANVGPDDLAAAMGIVLARGTEEIVQWVESSLR